MSKMAFKEIPAIGLIPTKYKIDCHWETTPLVVTEMHPSGAFNCKTFSSGKVAGFHIDRFEADDRDKVTVGSLFYVTQLIKTSVALPYPDHLFAPKFQLSHGYGYTRDNTYE